MCVTSPQLYFLLRNMLQPKSKLQIMCYKSYAEHDGCLCMSVVLQTYPNLILMWCDTCAETYFVARYKCFDIVWDFESGQ